MFAVNARIIQIIVILFSALLSACASQESRDAAITDSPTTHTTEELVSTSDLVSAESPNSSLNSDVTLASVAVFVDQDADGVADADDQCKDTPSAAMVNSRGCPLDTDGDKVADYLDTCVGTPLGIEVDARGCGYDDDHDGVPDWRDSCGGSPPFVAIGGNGCELDNDADGVVDSRDQCAGTPPGLEVEPMGCHLTDLLVLRGANFQTGSYDLSASAQRVLHDLAVTLKRHPKMRVSIAGHTDDRGATTLNRALSEQRAQSAKAFLVHLGVSPRVLSIKGVGGARPVANNDTEVGRAQNRRVEMRIVEID